jgi:Protein of unknown function (DUF3311)
VYVNVLFLVPFVALLSPLYLRDEPRIAGFPFFYWYQFVCLIVTAVLTWIVYIVRGAQRP